MITADSRVQGSSDIAELDGIRVLRLKTLEHKNIGVIRRAIAEIFMPFFMIRNFRKSAFKTTQWDALVWYSPTIFLGPFIYYLKRRNACPSYLILRDIFPAWALDLGLIRKGFAYYLFRIFERFQYSIADCIGVQAIGNLDYFKSWPSLTQKRIEVLQNWLTPRPISYCNIDISTLPIANRKIFIYAGNMGIAQGMGDLLILAEALLDRIDIGFLFIGRGSDMELLKLDASNRGLVNIVFLEEINAEQIPGLYAQCHVGLIALDPRHKTHNIPGKFLSYLQSGLPVMAIVNHGNDLLLMIEKYQIGRVTTDRSQKNLKLIAESIIEEISLHDGKTNTRCKNLAATLFSTQAAVEQIVKMLNFSK
ncbi:glycosyltransferase family 4 protein [Polynucleobacter sp.]|uniref:glycosyltransferase family 4 protein n=1 Tax=Polynucleobacter sp. TaxID=2029855 RepID=UPI003F69544F